MQAAYQQCPLCDRDAAYEVTNQPYGKRFTCSECSDFFIDHSSELHIAGLPEVTRTEFRKRLKEKAKRCGPGGLLVMRAPHPDEIGGDGHSVARTKLIAECISSKPAA